MAQEKSKGKVALRPSQNTADLERPANFPGPYVRRIPRRKSMRDQAAMLAAQQTQAETRRSAVRPDTNDSDTTINRGEAQKLFEEAGLGGNFAWAWENAIQGIRKSGSGYEVEEAAVQTAIATMVAYEAEKGEATEDEEDGDDA